jgi:hypothetical protein
MPSSKTALALVLVAITVAGCSSATTRRRSKGPRRNDPHQIGNGYINGFPPDYVPRGGETPRDPTYERPEAPDPSHEPPTYDPPPQAADNNNNDRPDPVGDCPSCR